MNCSLCGIPARAEALVCGLCGTMLTGRSDEWAIVPMPAGEAAPADTEEVLLPVPVEQRGVVAPQRWGSGVVAGTIVRTEEPRSMEGRRDRWALGCVLLMILAMLPFAVVAWFLATAFHVLMWIFGAIGLGVGAGGGLVAGLVLHYALERVLLRPEPVPVFHHVVEREDGGQELVRQEGDFEDGRVFVGNRVRFRGHRRNGTFVVDGGVNETLGAMLTRRRSGWRPAFLLLAMVVGTEYEMPKARTGTSTP